MSSYDTLLHCVCVGQSADAVVRTPAVQSLLLTAPWLPAFISAYVTMLESKAEVGCKSCSGIAVFLQGIQMIACRHKTSVPLSHTVMAGGRLLVQFQPETQILFGLCKKGHPCGDCVDPVPGTCSGALMEASAAPGASVTPQRQICVHAAAHSGTPLRVVSRVCSCLMV